MKILQICPRHLSELAALPWEIQKIFNSIIHTYCNTLADATWKCQHNKLWNAKLSHLTEDLLRSLKRWRLWREPVVGCHRWLWKNRLWCVATGISGKQCHSKCSEWPPSALIHASSLFRHWSVTWYTTLCWNSDHVATSRCCRPHVRSVPQTQY